jgi:hypothetical protein
VSTAKEYLSHGTVVRLLLVTDNERGQQATVEFADNVGIAVIYRDLSEMFIPWNEVRAVVIAE